MKEREKGKEREEKGEIITERKDVERRKPGDGGSLTEEVCDKSQQEHNDNDSRRKKTKI